MDEVGQKREDDWFRKNEEELIATARAAREKREKERRDQVQAAELKRVKDLHFMKCPKCGHELKEQALDKVTVDRCTLCEGIFLDAGELETLYLTREADRRGMMKRLLGL